MYIIKLPKNFQVEELNNIKLKLSKKNNRNNVIYSNDKVEIALEDVDAPRSASDYQVQIDVRSGKQAQTTALMMLDDTGLIPRDQPGLVLPTIPQNAKNRMQKALNDAKQAKDHISKTAQSQSPSQP
jgi:hypothetical protein